MVSSSSFPVYKQRYPYNLHGTGLILLVVSICHVVVRHAGFIRHERKFTVAEKFYSEATIHAVQYWHVKEIVFFWAMGRLTKTII